MGNALIIYFNRAGMQLGPPGRSFALSTRTSILKPRILKTGAAKLNPAHENKLRRGCILASLRCFVADAGEGHQRLETPVPPPRRTWSMEIGPPPKKIRAKARVAAARGNS
jgi:hypothetical protein